ncbi:MAG: deoxyribonuclease V [Bryobacterales bacterium]|nr:deoxyribonuclease V [Bryobacterales bacterium]
MQPRLEMRWDVAPEEAAQLQTELAASVVAEDALPAEVRTVAGVDVAYAEDSAETFAAVIVFDAATLREVERQTAQAAVDFPYVPGLFSFRELPAISAALAKLPLTPDLVICDGHGIAHPRRFGLASHLGVLYDVPSIGCAKTHFFGAAGTPGHTRGDEAPITDREQTIGAVLRTQNGVKPVYVSTGHRVGLETACRWILKLAARYRLPEPIRAANTAVQTMKANYGAR